MQFACVDGKTLIHSFPLWSWFTYDALPPPEGDHHMRNVIQFSAAELMPLLLCPAVSLAQDKWMLTFMLLCQFHNGLNWIPFTKHLFSGPWKNCHYDFEKGGFKVVRRYLLGMRKENCLQIAYFNGCLIGAIKAELLVHTHVFEQSELLHLIFCFLPLWETGNFTVQS